MPFFRPNARTFLITALLLESCAQKHPESNVKATAPAPIPVKTAQAESRQSNQSISVTGSLLPDETVGISSESAGRVTAIYADFGQTVRKNQIVARLDDAQYRYALERAQATLRQSQARLGLAADAPNHRPDTPAMREAEAQMQDARFKFRNAQALVKSGDISQEHFNELEKAYRAREAAYEETRNAMLTESANLEALQADVALAQKHVNDCVLRAPFGGTVSNRPISPGQYIKDNTTILTLVKSSPLRLRISLPQDATGTVLPGSTLTFTTDAAPGQRFHAVVRELDPSLDAQSRTLTVEARLDHKDPRLRPGMFVQVQLVTRPNVELTVVPQAALYSLAGLSKVFVIEHGRAHEVRLASLNTIGDWVEVPPGAVQPGDAVAVTNLSMLIDGSSVEPIRR